MPSCEICGGTSFRKLYAVENANITPSIPRYDILRCNDCGFCVMDPYPTREEVDSIYSQENIFSKSFLSTDGKRTDINPNDRKFLAGFLEPLYQKYSGTERFIVKHLTQLCRADGPKVLEIGCGRGKLLRELRKQMPHARLLGMDIDGEAREKAHPDIRDAIVVGDVLSTEIDGDHDIVIMNFIIEHLHDHGAFVRKAASVLKPGGLLVITTPDIDSRKAKALKENWSSINCPHIKTGHIKWFNEQSLRMLAARHGFEVELATRKGEVFHCLPGIVQRLLTAVLKKERLGVHERFIRNYQLRMAWCIVMDGMLGSRFGLGEHLFVFMRKQPSTGN